MGTLTATKSGRLFKDDEFRNMNKLIMHVLLNMVVSEIETLLMALFTREHYQDRISSYKHFL